MATVKELTDSIIEGVIKIRELTVSPVSETALKALETALKETDETVWSLVDMLEED